MITQGFITTMQQEYLLIIISSNVLYANYKDNSESGKERCICIYFFLLSFETEREFCASCLEQCLAAVPDVEPETLIKINLSY